MSQKSKELPDNTKRVGAKTRPIAGRPVRTESTQTTQTSQTTQAQNGAGGRTIAPRRPATTSAPPVRTTLQVRRPAGGVAARSSRLLIPLAGGLGGVALAALGEILVESGDRTYISPLLYLAGIAIFAVSAWRVPPTAHDMPADGETLATSGAERKRAWMILGGGVGLALVLNLVAVLLIREQLDSVPGLYLWLLSLLVIGATGIVGRRLLNWTPKWGVGVWPTSRNGRLILLGAMVLILVVASASRLIALDKIPFGINADEGDRAATSIQIVRGDDTSSIFGNGWYFISTFYFWLVAQLMKVIGIGYVQARVFGALASIISVGTITWLGIRHFNVRVGLIAGGLLSMLAISLQFARETSEAGPTATLWAVSFALMLEGARTGKAWAWIGSGLAGGFSLYFYPSGRLWAVVAVAFSVYLLVRGLGAGVKRTDILRGLVLAAVASVMVAGPFLVHTMSIFGLPGQIDVFSIRAQETSIFFRDNPTRLSYYHSDWNIVQLLAAQVERAIGMFNQYHDDGGFWPTDQPIMSGLLTVLTLLGIGWVSTRWRDPRYVLLAMWFWVGLAAVIVTVETPNVQRFATAVPVLALFPALVLDNLALRVENILSKRQKIESTKPVWMTSGVIAAVTLFLVMIQYDFYFNVYAHDDRWPQPTTQGKAVNDQGTDTLVVSLTRQFHQVNSGWVRLLAPYTPRGGTKNPGMDLPLDVAANKNLAFMLYPPQVDYISYLRSLYPGGVTIPYTHTTEGLVVEMYKVPQDQWASTQGAMAQVEGTTGRSAPVRVSTLGAVLPGLSALPAQVKWTAGLRVTRYWNYSFRVNGPARLTIDGVQVFDAPDGQQAQGTVSLARGMHYAVYESTLKGEGLSAQVEWAPEPERESGKPLPAPRWSPIRPEELYALMPGPQGLYGLAQVEDNDHPRPAQHRIDGTMAFCCLTDQLDVRGKPYSVKWTGTLNAPVTGAYSMTLFVQGTVDLKIDNQTLVHSDEASEIEVGASADLSEGPHPIEIDFSVKDGPGGLQWAWIPPGGEKTIVPPWVLSPPAGAGTGKALPQDVIGPMKDQPETPPLETIP